MVALLVPLTGEVGDMGVCSFGDGEVGRFGPVGSETLSGFLYMRE